MKRSRVFRPVFFVSDRTGKTAESIGQSLLTQFEGFEFGYFYFPFISTEEEAQLVAEEIVKATGKYRVQPLVFSTLVGERMQDIIAGSNACVIDLFKTFIVPLEESLEIQSSHNMGMTHEGYGEAQYHRRVDAIDFTIKNDDGISINDYSNAEVILVGVSRCAKTPTCLYLSMHYSIKAANYPLTMDDLDHEYLPEFLRKEKEKLMGLTIKPEQLSEIRQKRRPGTEYASIENCIKEVAKAEKIFRDNHIPVVESTLTSIEEISVRIVKAKRLMIH